jgi:D-alanyl-D-alanine carboxypeptidase
MIAAELPGELYEALSELSAWSGDFERDLLSVLAGPAHLRALVDPWRPLPEGYSPPDLVPLRAGSFRVARNDLSLRAEAAASLEEMAAAAAADGVVLTAASGYRSFERQAEVHERLAAQMGRAAAERVSARPGHSQHQTGLALDFAPIDASFALTPAGRWMEENAGRFGWSLSYPEGLEAATGYVWESWHFRYLGRELAAFAERRFGGAQQHALRFLHEWEALGP